MSEFALPSQPLAGTRLKDRRGYIWTRFSGGWKTSDDVPNLTWYELLYWGPLTELEEKPGAVHYHLTDEKLLLAVCESPGRWLHVTVYTNSQGQLRAASMGYPDDDVYANKWINL